MRELVIDFITADLAAARLLAQEQSNFLLTEMADFICTELFDEYYDSTDTMRQIAERQALLNLCREKGVVQGWEEWHSYKDRIIPATLDFIQVRFGGWRETKEVADANASLLTTYA